MALIKCPECGKEVSDSVRFCDNCGHKFSETVVDVVSEQNEQLKYPERLIQMQRK